MTMIRRTMKRMAMLMTKNVGRYDNDGGKDNDSDSANSIDSEDCKMNENNVPLNFLTCRF